MKKTAILVDGRRFDSVLQASAKFGFSDRGFHNFIARKPPMGDSVFEWNGHLFSFNLTANMPAVDTLKTKKERMSSPPKKSSGFVEITSSADPLPSPPVKSHDDIVCDEIIHLADEVANINIEMFGLRERQKRILQSLDDLRRSVGIDIKKAVKR